MCVQERSDGKYLKLFLFFLAFFLGLLVGMTDIWLLPKLAEVVTSIFTNIFKFLSVPIIFLSIIVTLSKLSLDNNARMLWQHTVFYTIFTTIISAIISAILYSLIKPSNIDIINFDYAATSRTNDVTYIDYILTSVPSNIISPFLEQNILGILIISLAIGLAITTIKDDKLRKSNMQLFDGLYKVFSIVTSWVIIILPIGLFGFVSIAVKQINNSGGLLYIGEYLLIIICANLIQGVIILPTLLMVKGINPYMLIKKMIPVLSTAFFVKSSSAVLPLSLKNAEENLKIAPHVSGFVLPLCTSINMNGCAAFIFTTVIYVMQNIGITITPGTMILWIIISTIAAVGNAGVPMGCYFLTLSLLSSMNIPVILLGIILPFYSIIDMIETALNVWSDCCIAVIINEDMKKSCKTKRN